MGYCPERFRWGQSPLGLGKACLEKKMALPYEKSYFCPYKGSLLNYEKLVYPFNGFMDFGFAPFYGCKSHWLPAENQ